MTHWTKLAVAGIAAIGAAAIATPASAASGLQNHELAATSGARPEVTLVHRRNHGNRRYRDDDDFNVRLGLGFPLFAFGGGYPYRYGYNRYPYRYSYYDNDFEDSYLHCHGKKYWRKGKNRCTGKWHRHYSY